MEQDRQNAAQSNRGRIAKYENYRLLARVAVVVAIINVMGIAIWSFGLLNLPGYISGSMNGARAAALVVALLLMGVSADAGRPRGGRKDSRRLRLATAILFVAIAVTLVAESRLIYEGVRTITSLPH